MAGRWAKSHAQPIAHRDAFDADALGWHHTHANSNAESHRDAKPDRVAQSGSFAQCNATDAGNAGGGDAVANSNAISYAKSNGQIAMAASPIFADAIARSPAAKSTSC